MQPDPSRELIELDPHVDALIGRIVRAFSLLEYSVGRLACRLYENKFPVEVSEPSSPKSKRLQRLLGGSLGDHADCWREFHEVIGTAGRITQDDVLMYADKIERLGETRNMLCHGIWGRAPDSEMSVGRWSRTAVRALREEFPESTGGPARRNMSLADLEQLNDELADWNRAVISWIEELDQLLAIRRAGETDVG